jgi:long-subunit acyl-CoA synthetase (AMP-forming)
VMLQLGDHRPAKTDTMISYLPLAHMLERCCEVRAQRRLRHGLGVACGSSSFSPTQHHLQPFCGHF